MTYGKEEAKIGIGKLVEDFKRNRSRLRGEAEAQIENNFIRPLFKYLNWNTVNEGLAVTDYEFVVNRTCRGGKRPDYTLQLDGQHLLVMDAKQVKYDMHDPRWLNQVYAYGYSTQNLAPARRIDFAVLTDFEEFVVLDCTLHVNDPRALRNFLVLNWTCDDYINQFDRLWDLFERENMRRTARTRHSDTPRGLWALALSPRKVKANRIPPDKAFLADMDNDQNGWRVRLAKDMKKHNPAADGTLITAAVQLLIDRLIFVKALSDREIEDDYLAQLAETVEKDGLDDGDIGWFAACRKIFEKLDRFYNGSIFKSRPELEAVAVSNKTVRDIIHSLQPENSPYNFAVLPVEILGTIYERFLGRVVRTTEQRVKIEEKPEVRKAGGVYYTPQYIVEYIVKNTVGKLLEACKTPGDAAKLKILDPACGSGSFLVGVYAFLIDWHIKYFDSKKKLSAADRPDAYYDSDGRVRLTARLKREILINNLFGVDIDQQAVEVTRFSLSLKALEDTRREELYEERSLFKETVLPDLNNNIKCGNSLIGPDYFSGKMFPDSEELRRVNPFDWQREFSAIFSSGGFDAVIGNPPYVRMEEFKPIKFYLKTKYRSHEERADVFTYFLEQAIRLTNFRAIIGMILSNKFSIAKYGKPLREMIEENTCIEEITDFAGVRIFKGATVRTFVLFLRHRQENRLIRTRYVPVPEKVNFEKIEKGIITVEEYAKQTVKLLACGQLTSAPWQLISETESSLLNRLAKDYRTLRQTFKWRPLFGIKTGLNEAFVIDEKTRIKLIEKHKASAQVIRPILFGKDVKRYRVQNENRYVIYLHPNVTDINKYPAIKKHLLNYQTQLICRAASQKWFELQQPATTLIPHLEKRKIVYPIIAPGPRFALDDQGYFVNDKLFILPTDSLFLLGILNSTLAHFFFSSICARLEGAGECYYEYRAQFVERFPVCKLEFMSELDKSRHYRMVQLVGSMLDLHKHKATASTQVTQDQIQRQIDAIDQEIDTLVYKLYELTKEEIAIVKKSTSNKIT